MLISTLKAQIDALATSSSDADRVRGEREDAVTRLAEKDEVIQSLKVQSEQKVSV
jgi:hypothetical protein